MSNAGKNAVATSIISHWYKLIEKLQGSPLQFYQRLEQALAERKIPGLEVGRVEWHEGGPLSAKREYLRMTRERLVFDVCAAPFGAGFFVSWRLGEVPLSVNPLAILLALVAAGTALYFIVQAFGICLGLTVTVVGSIVLLYFLRSAISRGLADLDAALMKVPLLGPLYERFLRQITFYRIDVALMYQSAVHAAVMEAVDELTSAQGIAPLTELERKPILREIYSR
jgi:hypothetical protein